MRRYLVFAFSALISVGAVHSAFQAQPSPAGRRTPPMMAGADPRAVQRLAVPARRAFARRPRDHRDGCAIAAAHLLYGRRERRAVQDHRQRRELGAADRRPGPARLDRRGRGRRLGSEGDLPRHRIGRRPQQRIDRPRHVQVRGRRQDVDVCGPAERRTNRRCAHSPDRSQHRLGRGSGRRVQRPNPDRGVFKTAAPTAARRGTRLL